MLAWLWLVVCSGWSAEPAHVVFVIGDGMGLAQVTTARAVKGEDLYLQSAQAVGLQTTWSTELVTDSAAGATAMSCGIKTENGRVGQGPDGQACTTLIEEAIGASWRTGVVVTSRISHATPAAFLAHHPTRKEESAIAAQILQLPVDLLVGGGRDMFPTGRAALRPWRERRVTVLDGRQAILAHHALPLVGFTSPASPPAVAERGPTAPLATHALGLLREGSQRSFLLVEGSQIDWGGHRNDVDGVVSEVFDLDDTVRALVQAGGEDTLVVVTADHDTGGLSLLGGQVSGGPVDAHFSTSGHSAVMVPVYAWGPGAEAFTGVYDNTALHGRLRAAMGLGQP